MMINILYIVVVDKINDGITVYSGDDTHTGWYSGKVLE